MIPKGLLGSPCSGEHHLSALQSILGVAVILGLAWLLSERRKDVVWSAIAKGIALQFVIALLLTKVPVIQRGLEAL